MAPYPEGSNSYHGYKHFIVDDSLKVVYCYVPKTACSSLKYLLTNRRTPTEPDDHVHNVTKLKQTGMYLLSDIKDDITRQSILGHYHKIVIVRNPYERLYSGYVDKFINSYEEYGSKRAYREVTNILFPDTRVNKNGGLFITFEQFLQMVTQSKQTLLPSLARPRRDEHWSAISQLCYPCHVQYDYILRLETLGRDKELILPLLNATDLPQVNRAKGQLINIFNVSIPDIRTAYGQVSPHIMQHIHDIYQPDLDLFSYGYHPEKGPYYL